MTPRGGLPLCPSWEEGQLRPTCSPQSKPWSSSRINLVPPPNAIASLAAIATRRYVPARCSDSAEFCASRVTSLARWRRISGLRIGRRAYGQSTRGTGGLDGQRAALFALGDREGVRRVAARLIQGLDSGRWLITRGMAEFYRDEVGADSRSDAWRLADALSEVWREGDGRLPARGQRVFSRDGRGVLVLWRSSGSRTALLAAFADSFFTWPPFGGIAWQLADPEGH